MKVKAECTNIFDSNDEIIITSVLPVEDRLFLSGSIKEKHYKVILIKLNSSFEIEYQKEFSNSETSDYEGQNMIIQDDSLLISGCSEGLATDEGGCDWKAYLLKTSLDGIKEWDGSFRILGNECAFSVISNDNILLFGNTKNDAGIAKLFLLCLDQEGNLLWKRLYGEGTSAIAGGMIPTNDGYIISGSVKKDGIWHLLVFKLKMAGEVAWEKAFAGFYILRMSNIDDGFLLTGKKSGHISLMKVDYSGNVVWESTFDEGTGVSITTINDCIFLGGDLKVEEKRLPVLFKLDKNGKQVEKMIFEKDGWIETMAEFQGSLVAIRFGLTPKDHTELIQIKI